MPKTYTEQLQGFVSDYRNSGQPWPASSRQIAAWAVHEGKWRPQPSALVGQCAQHIARAMRAECITDPQGRIVRSKHAAKMFKGGEQTVLWADIRTASSEHMQIALQQRRQQIVGDCRQLKADADSYNENQNTGLPIQLSFDFTRDIMEMEAGLPLVA